MGNRAPLARKLAPVAFERLREQLAAACVFCSDQQLLDLADEVHDALRRRRRSRARPQVSGPESRPETHPGSRPPSRPVHDG